MLFDKCTATRTNSFSLQVLIDTRAIQKEINQLSGKLDRTFTVTDELIFRVCFES